jgi:tetratricopeptide (TPR) repeat protein
MTQLSALFTLAGFLGYLLSRKRYVNGNRLQGLAGMSLSVGMGITLGVLAKENAILLPLYILAVETTILASDKKTVEWKIWAWIFLALPLVMLLIYLAASLDSLLSNYSFRSFTMSERLLTQAVVLVTYLKNIVLPQSGAFSIFQDDFPISAGLFSPPETFFSIMILVAMVFAAIFFRKKYSLASFAVLWFFSGHVLESTFINLEIYFEHRNYLPSFGILFLYGGLIVYVWRLIKNRMIGFVMCSVPCLIILGVTIMEVSVWKDPLLQAHEWARHHPTSVRAVANLGTKYILAGNLSGAEDIYSQAIQTFPKDLYLHVRLARIKSCVKGEKLTELEWNELNQKAETYKWQNPFLDTELDSLVIDIFEDRCPEMGVIQLAIFILTLAGNPGFLHSAGLYHEFVAALSLKLGDLNAALLNIREAVRHSPKPNRQIFLIEMELAMEHIGEAEKSIQEFSKYLADKPRIYLAYGDKLNSLKEQLQVLKAEGSENEN